VHTQKSKGKLDNLRVSLHWNVTSTIENRNDAIVKQCGVHCSDDRKKKTFADCEPTA